MVIFPESRVVKWQWRGSQELRKHARCCRYRKELCSGKGHHRDVAHLATKEEAESDPETELCSIVFLKEEANSDVVKST